MKCWFIASALAVLPLQGQVVLEFTSGSSIPDGGEEVGLAHTVSVSTALTRIDDLNVRLHITPLDGDGAWNGDLYAHLEHNGQLVVLLNRVGRTSNSGLGSLGSPDNGFQVTLDDEASIDIHLHSPVSQPSLPAPQIPLTGTWQPDGRAGVNPATAVASSPRSSSLAQFHGLNPNGAWTLFLSDYSLGGAAVLTSWSLEISQVPEPSQFLFVAASALLAAATVRRLRHR